MAVARPGRLPSESTSLVAWRLMWADTEEERSDFILAAATAVFGPLFYIFVIQILPLGRLGMLGALLDAVLIFAVAGLVPLLLARYRGQGAEAFGLDVETRDGIRAGLLLAAPVVAVGLLALFAQLGARPLIFVGVLGGVIAGPFEALITVVRVAALFFGGLLLYTFLTVKARNGFARNEIRQLEALRTFGMGAAGAGAVIGLIVVATGAVSFGRMLLTVAGLVVVVLLTDRLVTPGAETSRATILAPAIIALLVGVRLFAARGFFVSLWEALLGAGLVIVLAVLIETRRYAWAVLPVLLAVAIYPSALGPFVRLAF